MNDGQNDPVATHLLLSVGATSAIVANMLTLIMIGQVNRKLPEDEQISYIFWGIGTVFRQHRRFYPRSYLVHLCVACGVVLVVSFVALAWNLPRSN